MHQVIWTLALGTFALRLVGPLCAGRLTLSAGQQKLLGDASILLLCALATSSALLDGAVFAGWARLLGVLTGVALVLARAPFPLVVIASACVAAALRWYGIG
jgi:branched-subunit amino acid transport protein